MSPLFVVTRSMTGMPCPDTIMHGVTGSWTTLDGGGVAGHWTQSQSMHSWSIGMKMCTGEIRGKGVTVNAMTCLSALTILRAVVLIAENTPIA